MPNKTTLKITINVIETITIFYLLFLFNNKSKRALCLVGVLIQHTHKEIGQKDVLSVPVTEVIEHAV